MLPSNELPVKVLEVMTRDPAAAEPEWALAKAIGLMVERSIRHLPIVEHDSLVGVISDRDLLEATGWNPEQCSEADRSPKRVRDFMTVPVWTVSGEDDVKTAVSMLREKRLGCLPVTDAEYRLEGLLTVTDLLEAHVKACASAPGVAGLDAVVASWMGEAPITVDGKTNAAAGLELCNQHNVRHLLVECEGWFAGLVSDRDLRMCLGRGELDRQLEKIMSTGLTTIGPESLVSDAVQLMLNRRIDSVPVTREGRPVGMLTTTDVLGLLLDGLASSPGALRPDPA